jgi:C-terminal processing protease CtpA/Prc
VIIDVRNNGGGNTSDRIIDILERRPNARYQLRDEPPILGPGQTLNMPIVVMCAESSFSNAEMFPYAMRARELATLVGKPTPGYVIYTYGLPLIDGTSARMPSTGVYRLDGTPMENMGEVPDHVVDISVEQYLRGEDPQLERAIEVALSQLR